MKVLVRMTKSVCIIGAGPAGLATAKAFLLPEGAFQVTVFDKKARIGGLWPLSDADEGMINPSMSTNLSRHTVAFGGQPWPMQDGRSSYPLFPKAKQVGDYLQLFVKDHLEHSAVDIRTSCEVVEASNVQNSDGNVTWNVKVQRRPTADSSDGDAIEQHSFDHVVIASGFFGKPRTPECLRPTGNSSISIVHSSQFRSITELLKGSKAPPGKILVVGGSMSGAETAASVASQLSSEIHSPQKSEISRVEEYAVHHVTSSPFWTLPLLLPMKTEVEDPSSGGKILNPAPSFLPIDFVMFNLAYRSPEERMTSRAGIISEEGAQKTHEAFSAFNGGQAQPHGSSPGSKDTDAAWLGIVNDYSSYVRSGAINTIPGSLKSLGAEPNTAIIETPSSTETVRGISAIILATGFDASASLSFLPSSLLETLGYDASTPAFPLTLSWHTTIHPSVPSLGFVGFYRGPYWGIIQQQAALLRDLWSDLPASKALREKLQSATSPVPRLREVYKANPERLTQFPMGDYIHIMSDLLQLQGIPSLPAPKDSTCYPILPLDISPLPTSPPPTQPLSARDVAQSDVLASPQGRFLPRALFRALLGPWTLNRTIKSRHPGYPSGKLIGTAHFHPRTPTDSAFDAEYLFVEDGDFVTETGIRFRASRRYVYRYAERDDKLSVWFVKTDNLTVDYLFHELEIISPHDGHEQGETKEKAGVVVQPEKDRRWKARAHHLCIDDTYDPEYEFEFAGVEVREWSVGYSVKGPQKDYWIGSVFTRP